VEVRDGTATDNTFGPGGLAFDDFHEVLGMSNEQLRQYLLQRGGTKVTDADFAMFIQIGRALGETQALPEARIALFRLAASLSDTQDLGPTTDHSGRTGIGIGESAGGVQAQIVFDPDTALVLGEQVIAVGGGSTTKIDPADDAPPGSWTVYSDSALVDSLDQTT
jgi:hypothetical protein